MYSVCFIYFLMFCVFLQAYENLKDIKSKSSKLVVAAFDFGAIYSGCAFSCRSEWSKVVVTTLKNGYSEPNVPTTLLLNSDQSFRAFGYEAEDIYFKLADNDSESDEDDKSSKQNCNDFYYFQKLTLCLQVSKFNFMLQRYPCNFSSSSVTNL